MLDTQKHNDVTVLILAGGKSIRMGTDKGLMRLSNTTFGEEMLSLANNISDHVIVSVNSHNQHYYESLGAKTIADQIPNQGPIGGIVSALSQVNTPWFFVMSVDSPLFTIELFELLWNERHGQKAVLFSSLDKIYPLLALYQTKTSPVWEKALSDSKLKVVSLVKSLGYKLVELDSDKAHLIVNVNTLSEYNKLKISL